MNKADKIMEIAKICSQMLVDECRVNEMLDCPVLISSISSMFGGFLWAFCEVHRQSPLLAYAEIAGSMIGGPKSESDRCFFKKLLEEAHREPKQNSGQER